MEIFAKSKPPTVFVQSGACYVYILFVAMLSFGLFKVKKEDTCAYQKQSNDKVDNGDLLIAVRLHYHSEYNAENGGHEIEYGNA